VLKKYRIFCFFVMSFFVFPSSALAENVSVLVLYTQAAKNTVAGGAIEDKINFYIDTSNDSYAASNIDINLTLAATQLVSNVDDSLSSGGGQNYSSLDSLHDLTYGVPPFDGVLGMRDAVGADFVVLLRDIQDAGGWGWVPSSNFANLAYSVVRIKNPNTTFTHEIGHNMGLAHSRRQVASGEGAGIMPYAAGHGLDRTSYENGFVTIMAYNSVFNNAPRLELLSNPAVSCDSGTSVTPCGVSENNATSGANSAKVLNDRKTIYSGYRIAPTVGSVSFADNNLSSCLSPSQNTLIPNFTNLNCANHSIESIGGVDNLTGLTYVNFQDNNIYSLQPLFSLPNLQSAVVAGNDNAICSHLTQLEAKLGSSNVVRSSECFPLAAVLVAVNSILL